MKKKEGAHFRDEREDMTQAEWDEMQRDLQEHLKQVEERFWESVRVRPAPKA